jgi:peptidoglycan hydrolase-like protein with peptidoglycan-binding domain
MSRLRRPGRRSSLRSFAFVGTLVASLLVASPVAAAPRFPHQSVGNRGVDVKAIQGFLRHHGATMRVDGIFGATTVAAVRDFQLARGLAVTGAVDEATWVALVVRVADGSTGEAVRALQRQLNEKRGAGLMINGVYGPATRTALLGFQRHMGLTRNGIAGPLTWRFLIAHFERPLFGSRVCDYQVGNGTADWGTASAIGQVEAAAGRLVALGHGRVAIGDVGYEHGGDIPGHTSHERGLDVDLRPMRADEAQCRLGSTSWRSSAYDRAATRDLVRAIRAAAPGHVRIIWFNDPVLIREGLTRWSAGHDDHLHVRYCERAHPVPAYDC